MTKILKSESKFLDVTSFDFHAFAELAKMDSETRNKTIQGKTQSSWTPKELANITKMTFLEELTAVCLFLFGVPGSVFSIPVLLSIIGLMTQNLIKTYIVGLLFLIPLTLLPAPYSKKALSSWYALQILRYFSFKAIFAEPIIENKPYILVAPPHGVFPFGNIVTMIAFPSIMGFAFKGLAASAAVTMPIFKQLLCTIGVISASRKSATKALNDNRTIGISTGGVAEVFETNSASGDEVIVLKNRKGIVKLAFRTGASLVPCYLFGNTHLLSLWTGGSWHEFIKSLSRKSGVALIVFWGRFFLPIPYRVPILGAMGKPIAVPKVDEPSDEEVDRVHAELLVAMVALFDEHKAAYGWEKKNLIIL